ncbi:MAG: hypothetical protein ACKOXP_10815 [Flavobacteriales bacterium]
MLRIFLPIFIGLIVWIIVLWQLLVKKKKVDMNALLVISAIFTVIWLIIYWILFR